MDRVLVFVSKEGAKNSHKDKRMASKKGRYAKVGRESLSLIRLAFTRVARFLRLIYAKCTYDYMEVHTRNEINPRIVLFFFVS